MGYATITQFRGLTNIKKELVSDSDLTKIFLIADRLINKLISTPVKREKLSGTVNGTNVDFKTAHAPVCDTTIKNVTLVDACNAVTGWTKGNDGADIAVARRLAYGGAALTLEKDGTSAVISSWTKTLGTAVDGTGRRLKITIFIKDINELDPDNAISVRIGNDSSNYYSRTFGKSDLKNGFNEIDLEVGSVDMGLTGTVTLTALDYLYISHSIPTSTDTVAAGQIIMDYWRLEDIDSPDTSDIKVFYATADDTTGWTEYGSAQTISSIQAEEGIITMSTAPTTATAEDGVFAEYAYASRDMDWELVNSAACYLAAHLASFKIAGSAPDFSNIADGFLRRDLAGVPDEWLRLCYSILMEAVGDGATGIGFRTVDVDDPMEDC